MVTLEGGHLPAPGRPRAVQTRTDLARELTELRQQSGFTVRELARRAGAPTATVGDYLSGRHLPGQSQMPLFRRLLELCGVSSPEDLAEWEAALWRARTATDGRVARAAPPYRGLEPFEVQDAPIFFGRREAVQALVGRLAALRDDPGPSHGVLVVLGPSGSGKSSLLRAGLVPAVASGALDRPGEDWSCTVVVPGPHALEALEERDRRSVVVVDQFEECFSAPQVACEGLLSALPRRGGRQGLVVVGLRADFYRAAAGQLELLPALQHANFLLGPMTRAELREVVVGPAHQVGAAVEEGLVDVVLADMAGAGPGQAGALPLLSYALLAAWLHGTHNELTLADYRASGGLRGAVSQAAEELYQSLAPHERQVAARLFRRLVRVEGDEPFTRRRVRRGALVQLADPAEAAAAAEVLERFISARLLTAHSGWVEVSHEALLSAWPRLGQWLGEDRATVRLHHKLADDVSAWLASGRDPSLLYRGARLEAVVDWASGPAEQAGLTEAEQAFLQASGAYDEAEQRLARHSVRRTRQLLGVVAVLALVAVVLAGYAWSARASANLARNRALSRQVAIEADQLEGVDPSLAMQLALAGYRISPTLQARSALVGTSAGEMPTRVLGPPGPAFLATDRGGRLLAVARSGADDVELYRLGATGTPRPLGHLRAGGPANQDFALALSPDGAWLAVGGTDRRVQLFDVARPGRPVPGPVLGGFGGTVYSLAFSPDGLALAGAASDGEVHLWHAGQQGWSSPVAAGRLQAKGPGALKAVAFSPDGKYLAAAGTDGLLLLWRPRRRARALTGAGGATLESLAFSPDGHYLVTGGDDGLVRRWALGTGAASARPLAPLVGATSYVNSVSFSADGSLLVAGSSDGTVHLWRTAGWSSLATLPQPRPVSSVLALGNHGLASATNAGTTTLWQVPPPGSAQLSGNVYFLSYLQGGRELAAVTGGARGDLSLWDMADPFAPRHLADVVPPAGFGPVAGTAAVSPDGRLMAAANARGQMALFDIAQPAHPRQVGPLLAGTRPDVEQARFLDGGRLLVAADDASQVLVWDVARPSHPRLLSVMHVPGQALGLSVSPHGRLLAAASSTGRALLFDLAHPAHPVLLARLGGFASYVYSTAFSPSGRLLAASSADGTVRLWDVASPAHPVPAGPPLAGPNGEVFQVAFSPDGRTLAAATTEHQVWLWDVSDPARAVARDVLTAAQDSVFAVAFSPDGRYLVASGSDHVLHVWLYRSAAVAARVCALAGSPVTPREWAQYVQGRAYSPPCRGAA